MRVRTVSDKTITITRSPPHRKAHLVKTHYFDSAFTKTSKNAQTGLTAESQDDAEMFMFQ